MRQKTVSIFLFLMVLIELLSSTVWTEYIHMNNCRYVHFIAGVSIFTLLFLKSEYTNTGSSNDSKLIPWLLLAFIFYWSIPKMNALFIQQPIDFQFADMLPVIKTMCERWLSLQPVYIIIPEIWSGVMPVYLPAMYLPYVPAILLHFDMRWIGYAFTLVPLVYIILIRKSSAVSWLIFILIGLFLDFILHQRNEAFTLSEEGVVYGYYMLFAFFIYHRQYTGIGIIAACCLLSRYSGVFFSGALAVCLLMMNQKIELKKYLGVGILCGLILITAGRAWSYILHFFGLSNVYVQNIKENPAKYQNVLNDGLGFMPLIGLDHVQSVYYLQIALLILIAIVMFLLVKTHHHSFYYLAFLKLTMVVFYNFLILPYSYLMYTSVLLSFVLFFLYTNHTIDDEINLKHG